MIATAQLRHLRRPLIGGAFALAASSALLYWTHTEHSAASLQLQQEGARLVQARSRYLDLHQAHVATLAAQKQLATLNAAGQLNPPDRLAWHAHLQSVTDKAPGNALDWEIGPKTPYTDTLPPATAAPGLVVSTLHLHGEIAHEAHLLAALQRPSGQPRGVFLPQHCRLSRSPASNDDNKPRGLAVNCEIDWIALQRPTAQP